MKYVGSKNRFRNELIPIIQNFINENNSIGYYEPFVGGCNVIDKIQCKKRIGNDAHKYLIAMFKELQKGWIPPVTISEYEYTLVHKNINDYPDHYIGLVGFAATYGSKWFGGYARGFKADKVTPRDIPAEAIRNIMKQVINIKDIKLLYGDYIKNTPINKLKNWVIYCDPPYEKTLSYKNSINHSEFWEWCVLMSKDNIVLVSEYDAPDGWECIWIKDTTTSLKTNVHEKRTESLFVYRELNEE